MKQTKLYKYSKCEPISLTLHPGKYLLEVWGGSSLVARGGYASGVLSIISETNAFLHIGSRSRSNDGFNEGGCNGGGSGFSDSGAGATDIRVVEDTVFHRIIVAGGAGGSAGPEPCGGGESGGFLNRVGRGMPGTQNKPGEACVDNQFKCNPGNFGYGGNQTVKYGSGGGGGWYGGASGSEGMNAWISAGGGSGYVLTETSEKPDFYALKTARQFFLKDAKMKSGDSSVPSPEDSSKEENYEGDGCI